MVAAASVNVQPNITSFDVISRFLSEPTSHLLRNYALASEDVSSTSSFCFKKKIKVFRKKEKKKRKKKRVGGGGVM